MSQDQVLGCVGAIVLAIVAVIFAAFLAALPVWILWNWLMPRLFELPWLSFWDALGLSLLCSLLFKSHNTSSSKKD